MESRKNPLVTNQYYHIFSRSIAKYTIFNCNDDYLRIINILDLYRFIDFNYKYSRFCTLDIKTQDAIISNLKKSSPVVVEIVAYCIMPTHIHLVLKQIADKGISKYMAKVLNSYSRYFNTKYKRMGPLWESRFKSVLVDSDEQLLHLSRYIHLNPTSTGLVEKPQDWQFSSYREYIDTEISETNQLCVFNNLFDLKPKQYQKFVNDRKSYQKQFSIIKRILIDDYTG